MLLFTVWGVDVNLVAIILAVAVNVVIVLIRHGLPKKSKEIVGVVVVASLVAAGLNSILQFAAIVSELSPILNIFSTAAMISFTIVLPVYINQHIWSDRSLKLIATDFAYKFVTYVAMGSVLVWFYN